MFLWLIRILALEVTSWRYTTPLPTCGYMNVLNHAPFCQIHKKEENNHSPNSSNSYNLFHYLERSFLGENQVSDAVSNEIGSFPNPSCCNTFLLFGPTFSRCLLKNFQKQLTAKTHTQVHLSLDFPPKSFIWLDHSCWLLLLSLSQCTGVSRGHGCCSVPTL